MPDRPHDLSPGAVTLRAPQPGDIPTLFRHQLDPDANRMAGTKPRSADVFNAVWEKIVDDPAALARVILKDGLVVGAISCFKSDGLDAVGYWIAREHWGQGIATRALAQFLEHVPNRPLHATAARDNAASIHILLTRGFRPTGYHEGAETDRYLAREVATFVLE